MSALNKFVFLILLALISNFVFSQNNVVNVYSARHYDGDIALFKQFSQETGIKVNLVEGKSDALIERMISEGANSPADILITADAGRLWRAEQAGLFASVESDILNSAIPAQFRHPENKWFGLTKRLRFIVYSNETVSPHEITSYEDLSNKKWHNRICIRSSGNIYNQSLLASIIAAKGKIAAEEWAAGIVANMARKPQGGDRDQVKAIASGECDVAIINHYYLAKMLASNDKAQQRAAASVSIAWPNQEDRGVHANISGAGVSINAPNYGNAVRLLEFLVSKDAQAKFAEANYEYPIVDGVDLAEIVSNFGQFKTDPVNVSVYGENNPEAVMIMDRVGWE